MPLLDHFRPPVSERIQWNTVFSGWATRLADQITERLPDEFTAGEFLLSAGKVAAEIASFQANADLESDPFGPGAWRPPAPRHTLPVTFPDRYEVQVHRHFGGRIHMATVAFVAPGNKETLAARRAFARRVVSDLSDGVCVVVVDVVTNPRAGLHGEVVRLLDVPAEAVLPTGAELSATTYRPVIRDGRSEVDVWATGFTVGESLPTMPLRVAGDLFIPVDFEPTYMETCRRRRVI